MKQLKIRIRSFPAHLGNPDPIPSGSALDPDLDWVQI
jgi:hypothetical protein